VEKVRRAMPRSLLLITLLAIFLYAAAGCRSNESVQRLTPVEEQLSLLTSHNRRVIETSDGLVVDYYISGLAVNHTAELIVTELKSKGLAWSMRNVTPSGSILLVPMGPKKQGGPSYINVKPGQPRSREAGLNGNSAPGCTVEYIY
jgi:hypothetical protein